MSPEPSFSDRLTVEGIETEEQQKTMQQSGVNDLQGFLFSKPLTIEELQDSKMVAELIQCSANEDKTSKVNSLPINRMAG